MIFYIRIKIFTKFAVISGFFITIFTNEILFVVIKSVLNKINLTWHNTKLIIMLFFVAFLN